MLSPAAAVSAHECLHDVQLLHRRDVIFLGLILSVGVSAHGTTSVHFVEPAVKVDGQYYHKVLLM